MYESGFFSIGLSIFKMEYPLSYDVLFKKIKILARYEEMILDIINTPGDITENEIQDQLLSFFQKKKELIDDDVFCDFVLILKDIIHTSILTCAKITKIMEIMNVLFNKKEFEKQEEIVWIMKQHHKLINAHPLIKIIIDDNIEEFINFVSQTKTDLHYEIQDTLFTDYGIFDSTLSIIEYCMIFGAVSIFNYIFSMEDLEEEENLENKIPYHSLRYSFIGGNIHIFQIIQSKFLFNNENKRTKILNCIQNHQEYLYDYLSQTFKYRPSILDEIQNSFLSSNFIHLFKIIENNKEYFFHMIKNGEIGRYIGYSSSSLLHHFIICNLNFEINEKNCIFSIGCCFLTYFHGISYCFTKSTSAYCI